MINQPNDQEILENLRQDLGARYVTNDVADGDMEPRNINLGTVFLQQPAGTLQIDTPRLMEALRNKLREDEEFARGWQANISVQFVDAVKRGAYGQGGRYHLTGLELTTLASEAASNFLAVLMINPVSTDDR